MRLREQRSSQDGESFARWVCIPSQKPAVRQDADLTLAATQQCDGLFAAKQFQINPDDTVLATESPVTKAQTIFGLVGSTFGLTRQVTTVSN